MTRPLKKLKTTFNYKLIVGLIIGLACLIFMLLFRLGTIMPGITHGEQAFYSLKLGWHGIYSNPINLPLNFLWSIDFKYLAPVGMALLRLPAAITGGFCVIGFYLLLKFWYGSRTAIFGTILFASSAWTLHVSRLANYNVEFLATIVFFMLSTAILQKRYQSSYIYWLINLAWGLLIYVPGMVLVIAYNIFRQRSEIHYGLKQQSNFGFKLIYGLSAIIWLPLLIRYLVVTPKAILTWLGLPNHFSNILHIAKEFLAVFYHIFIAGPSTPSLWLEHTAILDIFGIITALIGLYFYLKHIKATRTHLLLFILIIGAILIALGGPVTLSFIMPVIYVFIAAGVAYLLSQWLSIFPENPIARAVGYTLISLAVAVSVIYNVRSYFIAWPNNNTSVSVFDVKDKD